jgi:hypothetical protein
MESRNKVTNNFSLALLILIFLQSCGFLESNSIKEEYTVFDNFKVIENKNQGKPNIQIVLNYEDNFFDIIEDNCVEIHNDSINLFVKSIKFDSVFGYYHIQLLQPTKNGEKALFKKTEIKEVDFKQIINKCQKCNQFPAHTPSFKQK